MIETYVMFSYYSRSGNGTSAISAQAAWPDFPCGILGASTFRDVRNKARRLGLRRKVNFDSRTTFEYFNIFYRISSCKKLLVHVRSTVGDHTRSIIY